MPENAKFACKNRLAKFQSGDSAKIAGGGRTSGKIFLPYFENPKLPEKENVMEVALLQIDSRYGINTWVCKNEEVAKATLSDYCRRNWREEMGEYGEEEEDFNPPADNEETIRLYFDWYENHRDSEESYKLTQEHVVEE